MDLAGVVKRSCRGPDENSGTSDKPAHGVEARCQWQQAGGVYRPVGGAQAQQTLVGRRHSD